MVCEQAVYFYNCTTSSSIGMELCCCQLHQKCYSILPYVGLIWAIRGTFG